MNKENFVNFGNDNGNECFENNKPKGRQIMCTTYSSKEESDTNKKKFDSRRLDRN